MAKDGVVAEKHVFKDLYDQGMKAFQDGKTLLEVFELARAEKSDEKSVSYILGYTDAIVQKLRAL